MKTHVPRIARQISAVLLSTMLASCMHDSSENDGDSSTTFKIGGTVSGLSGTLILQNNGADNLQLTANGAFSFATPLASGASYNVQVQTHPSGQACTVSNGTGTVNNADVTSVTVTCSNAFSVSGVITASANATVDSDINDPLAPFASNDDPGQAQTLSNPAVVGGFASKVGTGFVGDRFAIVGDEFDYYRVTVAAGQTITLFISDYDASNIEAIDLDLKLYDSTGVTVIDASLGTGDTESIAVASAGTYLVLVHGYEGISNYTLTIGAAPQASTVHDLNTAAEFVPGEVIVRFKDNMLPQGAKQDSLQARAAAFGLQGKAGAPGQAMLFSLGTGAAREQALTTLGVAPSKLAGGKATASSPQLADKLDTLRAVKALRARADVASADLNYIRKAFATPNDEFYGYQWHYPLINAPQAWDVTTGRTDVIVAVIDTGVYMAHPDLADNLTATGYDFISSSTAARDGGGIDNNPDDPGDSSIAGQSSWHGTHVAGTVAGASNNSAGIAGVNWTTKIMPLRVLGTGGGTSFDIMQAVRYAARLSNASGTLPAQRADVMNLSLGGPSASQSEQDTYTAARNEGVIIIAAAGNDNSSQLFYPASYNGVVSVSAVDLRKEKAPYSNFGTAVDIAAPGGDTSVDRNGDGYADGVLSAVANDSSGTRQPAFAFYQGTSMASPHVAGVAALMVAVRKAASSTLTPAEFDNFISGGTIVNDLGAAGRDDIFGYGLIDAFKAVQAASGTAPTSLIATPTSLNFGTLTGASSQLTFTLSKLGDGALTVTSVTSNAAWLTVSGSGIGAYTVTATKGALPDGVYSGTITITTSAATTLTVSASMRIGAAPTGTANAGYLYVLLVDVDTLDTLDLVAVAASNGQYTYSFSGVPAGTYLVVAGSDMDNDGLICDVGEACGAYPTLTSLTAVTVSGDATDIDFTAGFTAGIGAEAAGAEPVLKFSRRALKRVVGR